MRVCVCVCTHVRLVFYSVLQRNNGLGGKMKHSDYLQWGIEDDRDVCISGISVVTCLMFCRRAIDFFVSVGVIYTKSLNGAILYMT